MPNFNAKNSLSYVFQSRRGGLILLKITKKLNRG